MGVFESILRLSVDSTGAKKGSDAFVAETGKVKAAATDTAASADKLNASLNAAMRGAESAASDSSGLGKMSRSLREVASSGRQAGDAAKQSADDHRNLTSAMGMSHMQIQMVTAATRDMLGSMSAGASATRALTMQAPQLAQAFGVLNKIINPITLGLLALTGAVVAFGASGEATMRNAASLANAFALTGRSAELSTAQIKMLADNLQHLPGVSKSAANGIINEMAQARYLGGAQIAALTRIVGDYAVATGQTVPQASSELVKSLKDPLGAVQALYERFGTLTLSQYRQVDALMRTGEQAKAASLAMKYIEDAVKGATERGTTPFEKSLNSLGNAWHDLTKTLTDLTWATYFVKGISMGVEAIASLVNKVNKTPQEMLNSQLDGLLKQRQELTASYNSPFSNSYSREADARDLARTNQQIADIQKQRRALVETLSVNTATSASGVPNSNNAGNLLDPRVADELTKKYAGLRQQRLEIEQDIATLSKYRDGDRENWDLYTQAIGKAQDRLGTLKEATTLANEELAREANILAKPIAEREVYRARIEAVASALNAGRSAQDAHILGMVAEEKKLMELQSAYKDHLVDISNQIDANKRLAAAVSEGPAAVSKQQAANDALAESLKNVTVNTEELTLKNMDLKRSQEQLGYKQQIADQQQAISIAQAELNMVGLSKEQRNEELTLLKKRYDIQKQFPDLAEAERDKLLDMTKEQLKLNTQASKLNDIYDEARSTLDDTFTQVLDGGIKKFSDFGSAIKNVFVKLAAQIAQLLVFTPILNTIGGSLGLGGLSSGAGSLSGSGATTPSAGGVSSSSLLSGLGNLFGMSDAGGWLNGFGTNLGFASGNVMAAPSAAFVGPMPLESGSLFGTTSFSGFLGGVGAGFGAGSLLNGLIGGNQMGGTIGSGVGAAAGAAIGSIVPGIGTLLGGLIGGAGGGLFGGLFGPKKSVGPNANTNLNIKNGRFAVGETGADNGGDRAGTIALAQQAVDQLNKLIDTYGIAAYDPYNGGLSKTGTPHAIGFEVYTGDINKGKPQTPDDVLKFALSHGLIKSTEGGKTAGDFKTNVLYGTGGATDYYQRVINNTKATTVADFAKDLDIAKLIVDAKNLSKALDTVQQSFKTLSEQADDYVARAAKLGISSSDVLGALATNFNKTVSDSIKGIEDPYQAAYDTLIKDQDARLAYAKKIGADITQVEKLNLMEQKQLMIQYGKDTTAALEQMGSDLKKWLSGELLGSNSSLSPYGQFTEAQSQFNKAIDAARVAGPGADISSVTSLADQLLGLGKNTLGGATSDYSALEAMVRSTIQQLGKQLGLPGFATGGSFMVGGNGGTDSQLVAFKATPGEHVQISTPGQAMQSREGMTALVVTMQNELRSLHKELRVMNRNMSTNRAYDLVVRR